MDFTYLVEKLKEGGIDNPSLEARIIMAHVLDQGQASLNVREATVKDESALPLVQRRLAGEPLSKILGLKEFWSLPFKVSQDTLDPRPDSETLVEAVLKNAKPGPLELLDLGTGTGCLLLSLLSELPDSSGLGVDLSRAALKIAQENAETLGLKGQATFLQSRWFENVESQFDIILSNPPYITTTEIETLAKEVKQYDPHLALDGGEDGLESYRQIASAAGNYLKPSGFLALELGQGQGEQVIHIFSDSGFALQSIHKDLAGIDRVVVFNTG